MLSRTAIDLLVSWKNLHDEALYISFLPKQTQHFFSSLVFEGNSRGGNSDSSPVRIGIISHRLPNGPGSFFLFFFVRSFIYFVLPSAGGCRYVRTTHPLSGHHQSVSLPSPSCSFPLVYVFLFLFFFFCCVLGNSSADPPPPPDALIADPGGGPSHKS